MAGGLGGAGHDLRFDLGHFRNKSMMGLRIAKLLILAAAGISFLFSVYLWFLVDKQQGLFVGLWVPSILSFGVLLISRGGPRHG
jgi:hypothetical protein